MFLIVLSLVTSLIPIVGRLGPWPHGLDLRVDPLSASQSSSDFGHLVTASPAAVLRPASPLDVAALLRFSFASPNPFAVSARGSGHSVRGQSLAPDGVVVEMTAIGRRPCRINISVAADAGINYSYADVGGEQLWIDVLRRTLEHGLTPRSWTDYLGLTVGGTLSNAGVSGQAFRHGPQIANVYELDVISGKGEMMTCSDKLNSDLFYAVLGGLGQFGIITRARIALDPAPERVRWVRLIYTDFGEFSKDQERLISLEGRVGRFDYVEGFVLIDDGMMRSSFFSAADLSRVSELAAPYGAAYCLEGALYYHGSVAAATASSVDKELESLLQDLSFVPGFAFQNDVSYLRFLNRVHDGELKLRSIGLWDVPHPWLNIFVPKSAIQDFDRAVFKGILRNNTMMGPILIYPMNKNKWDERMSAVIPDEDVFYSVGLLRSAVKQDWESMDDQNKEILNFCDQSGIKFKQYLPHYRNRDDWMKHFGSKWDKFAEMKLKYDPKALLSPGQRIFISSLLKHVDQ